MDEKCKEVFIWVITNVNQHDVQNTLLRSFIIS